MKTGLVLEGGGMRGVYTVGVLAAFTEQNYMPDYLIGVSAGAGNGMSYLSGQQGRGLRVHMDYLGDNRYLSLSNFFKSGSLFGMDFIYDEIPNKLDLYDYKAFHRCPCEFRVGLTNAKTGRPEYFSKDAISGDCTAIRASSSLPAFSPAVKFRGKEYFDGGTSDPIPVRRAFADGCDRAVVVLTQDRNYRKQPQKFSAAYKIALRKYPKIIEALAVRHQVYNDTLDYIAQKEKEGTALVIAPEKPLGVGRFEKDSKKLMAIYEAGFAGGIRFLENHPEL